MQFTVSSVIDGDDKDLYNFRDFVWPHVLYDDNTWFLRLEYYLNAA